MISTSIHVRQTSTKLLLLSLLFTLVVSACSAKVTAESGAGSSDEVLQAAEQAVVDSVDESAQAEPTAVSVDAAQDDANAVEPTAVDESAQAEPTAVPVDAAQDDANAVEPTAVDESAQAEPTAAAVDAAQDDANAVEPTAVATAPAATAAPAAATPVPATSVPEATATSAATEVPTEPTAVPVEATPSSDYDGVLPVWFSIPEGFVLTDAALTTADVDVLTVDGTVTSFEAVCNQFVAQASAANVGTQVGTCENTVLFQQDNRSAAMQASSEGAVRFIFIGFELV